MPLHLQERQAAARCAYCHDPLAAAHSACLCGAAYHVDCFVELGRCATLGCFCRPGKTDRAASGRCQGCGVDVRRAFAWELGSCGECGARYHLGCRATRARCATRSCTSGAHDAWGAPRRRSVGALAASAGVAVARAARRRAEAALRAVVTAALLGARAAASLAWHLPGALVRTFAPPAGIWYKRPDELRTSRSGRDVVRPGPPAAPPVGSTWALHPHPGRVRPLQRGRGRRGR